MIPYLAALFNRLPLRVAAWLAGLSALLAALFWARKTGEDVVRNDQLRETVRIKDAQQKAAANAPRTKSAIIERLRNGKF